MGKELWVQLHLKIPLNLFLPTCSSETANNIPDQSSVEFNWICILWIQNRLIPWIKIKSGKYYTHTEVAGTTQLIQLGLSFSIYIKVYFYRVITIHHHHHHVPEGLGMFPVPWSSKWSWSLHLFFGRPMFLILLVYIVVLVLVFVSILCTCCSHFFWYCFISLII